MARHDIAHGIDLETDQTTWQLWVNGIIHGLKYASNPPMLLSCHGSEGLVTLLDPRAPQSTAEPSVGVNTGESSGNS